jgi:hypothetical protein
VSETFNASGSKYLREIQLHEGKVDVYAVLDAFQVTCPARQHAIKKLLCAGLRGKGGELQDLTEARDAIDRAIQMQSERNRMEPLSDFVLPTDRVVFKFHLDRCIDESP